MDVSPPGGLSTKLALLWNTNKPLVIGIIVGIILLILAVVFLVVFFTVIRPGMSSASTPVAPQASTTQGLTSQTSTPTPTNSTSKTPATSNTSSTSSSTTTKSTNTMPSPTSTTTTTTKHALGYQTLRSGQHLKGEWFN